MAKKIWWQCPQVTPHELYKAKIYSKKYSNNYKYIIMQVTKRALISA